MQMLLTPESFSRQPICRHAVAYRRYAGIGRERTAVTGRLCGKNGKAKEKE